MPRPPASGEPDRASGCALTARRGGATQDDSLLRGRLTNGAKMRQGEMILGYRLEACVDDGGQ
ncbi:hypothetical protein KKF91_20820, partial [Myxococcota bacterium]|nr:hypothetical protein [Myxococcota bacterium]